jgi:hypothetical protein
LESTGKRRKDGACNIVLQAIIFMQELLDHAEEGVTLPEFEGWLARQYE